MKQIIITVLLCFLFKIGCFGQPNLQYEKEFSELYPKLNRLKSDAVHQVCITFLKKYKILNDAPRLEQFCSKLIKKCEAENNANLSYRILIIQLTGTLKNSKASVEKCNSEFKKLFKKLYVEGNYSATLECMFELAQMHFFNKNQIEALKVLFFAEKFAKSQNLTTDLIYQGIVFKLGQTLLDIEQFESAIIYLKKSIQSGNSNSMDLQISYNGIGIALQKLYKFNESNTFLEKGSQIALSTKNSVFNNIILGNMAVNYFNLNQLDKSFENATIDKNSSLNNELWSNAIGAFHLLIEIELKRNNIDHSKILLDSMNVLMNKIPLDNYKSQKRKYESNYMYSIKINNSSEALNSYQKFIFFTNLFDKKFNSDKISMIEVKAKTAVFEHEMKEIEKHNKLKIIVFIILTSIIILILSILLRLFRKKLKISNQIKSEIEKLNEVKTLEISDLKTKLLNQLKLIQFNKFNSNEKKENSEILKTFSLSKKEQWIEFKNLFVKNHPELITKIDFLYKISEAELRLIMLHKLGLSNKEIASTLLISSDGVKKANYRLYKKLNIKSKIELNYFLEN